MKRVSIRLPSDILKEIDYLVKLNIFHSRSDFIRIAIRELLRKELSDEYW